MTDYCGDHGGTNRHGEPCGNESGWGTDFDSGKCRVHRGTSPDGSSHEGNDWAAKHGAWSESFMSDFLTESEQARVQDAIDVLETPEGAQAQASVAATIALEQFRRTGDDRFLRRYESICDTFGIAPDDDEGAEVDVNVDVNTLTSDEKSKLDALFDREVQQ